MKSENEIEKSKKRIELLENQNIRFKKLVKSALEVTKKTEKTTDEDEFWQETIKLIENEKVQMQEDLNLLSLIEDERHKELSFAVRKLESENLELQKKVEYLLQQTKLQSKKIEKLNTEQAEFKFLLTQPESNSQWLKNILQLDGTVTDRASALLFEERHKLQLKIVTLECKKTELLTAIEDISSPECVKKSSTNINSTHIKSDIDKALTKAINEVTKREFESLHLKVLELEDERAKLLNELQAVLDQSRKEIADEYYKLQQSILQIEAEKTCLKRTSKTVISNPENTREDENEDVDSILDAFSNKQHVDFKTLKSVSFQDTSESRSCVKLPLPICVVL